MADTTQTTCERCQRRDEDMERERAVDSNYDKAERSVYLVPGRAAAAIEFTYEELDALQTIMLYRSGVDSDQADARYHAALEQKGVSQDTWHLLFCKVTQPLHYPKTVRLVAERAAGR